MALGTLEVDSLRGALICVFVCSILIINIQIMGANLFSLIRRSIGVVISNCLLRVHSVHLALGAVSCSMPLLRQESKSVGVIAQICLPLLLELLD
jgi:hypothetical protein